MMSLKGPLNIISILFIFTMLACQKSPENGGIKTTHFGDTQFKGAEADLELTADEPLIQGSREYSKLSPIEIPEIVEQRNNAILDNGQDLAQQECPLNGPFRILDPKLLINVDTQVMSFKVTIESSRGKETVELSGAFEKDTSPWRSEMFAKDKKLLEERRVQATALCVTAGLCDLIAVNIYYELNGKAYCRQIRSGVKRPEILLSGHETLTQSNPPEESESADPTRDNDDDLIEEEPASEEEVLPEAKDITNGGAKAADEPSKGRDSIRPPVTPPQAPKPKAEPGKTAMKPRKNLGRGQTPITEMDPKRLKDEVIVMSGPIEVGPPVTNSEYRIKSLRPPPAKVSAAPQVNGNPGESVEVIPQAFGQHDAGKLIKATYLPLSGAGFVRRTLLAKGEVSPENDRSSGWGTESTIQLISQAGKNLSEAISGFQFVVTNISNRMGGKLPGHASHQNGLDIDLRYFYRNPGKEGFVPFDKKGRLSPEFEIENNWKMFKEFSSVGQGRVMVIFADDRIKGAMCKFARENSENIDDPNSLAYKTLRTIQHWRDHTNVFHVRLFCPGNKGCANLLVSYPLTHGCPPIKH